MGRNLITLASYPLPPSHMTDTFSLGLKGGWGIKRTGRSCGNEEIQPEPLSQNFSDLSRLYRTLHNLENSFVFYLVYDSSDWGVSPLLLVKGQGFLCSPASGLPESAAFFVQGCLLNFSLGVSGGRALLKGQPCLLCAGFSGSVVKRETR